MKKGLWFIIIGAALILLQGASLIFDLAQTGGLKFMASFSGNALMYNASYLSAGLAGLVLILWGIAVSRRKEK